MKYLLNSYKLHKLFYCFFYLAYNIIIIIVKFRFFVFKVPPIFYYKLAEYSSSVKFLFLEKFYYSSFTRHLLNFYNKCFVFYFFKLKLKGLGYRIFNVTKNLLKVFFNRSNFFYIYIPLSILLKNRTRRLFFISTSNEILSVTIIGILYLKEFVIYRQHGLYYPRQILLIKPGKNKFR